MLKKSTMNKGSYGIVRRLIICWTFLNITRLLNEGGAWDNLSKYRRWDVAINGRRSALLVIQAPGSWELYKLGALL